MIDFLNFLASAATLKRLDLLSQKVIGVPSQMDNFQIQLQSFPRKFKSPEFSIWASCFESKHFGIKIPLFQSQQVILWVCGPSLCDNNYLMIHDCHNVFQRFYGNKTYDDID